MVRLARPPGRLIAVSACLLLMLSLPAANWWRLFGWLAIGLIIYFAYGRFHSALGQELAANRVRA
jgi:APA family basic amino acid/polyamine antiporter